MSEENLILRHLLESGIFEADGENEMLPIFPRDSASSIAVTVVTSFSENWQKKLNNEFKIDWMMQVIAYCFTLPTLFQDAIENAMNIFNFWFFEKNFFKDKETQNKYVRQMFKHYSAICEYKNDNAHPFLRSQLIQQFQKNVKKFIKETDYSDSETWDTIIRVLIGCADYFQLKETQELFSIEIITEFYRLIFLALRYSNTTYDKTWSVLNKFIKKWINSEHFLDVISKAIIKEYNLLLKLLFQSSDLQLAESTKEKERNVSLVCFRITQYLNLLDFDVITSDFAYFSNITKLLKELVQQSQNFVENTQNLFIKLFPADLFFSLFGKLLFTPFSVCKDPSFLKQNTSILMNIAGNWDLSNSHWKKILLSVMHKSLELPITVTTLRYGYLLVSSFMTDDLVDIFTNIINKTHPDSFIDDEHRVWYSILLQDLSEVRDLDESVFTALFQNSRESKSLVRTFSILMDQSPHLFVKYSKNILNDANQQQSPFLEQISANLNLIVAYSIPFITELKDLLIEYISPAFDLVSQRNNSNSTLLYSFLVLLLQISKNNIVLTKEFTSRFTAFAQGIIEERNSSQLSNHIKSTEYFLVGNSIDTLLLQNYPIHVKEQKGITDPKLLLKPFYSVFFGNDRLVSLVGNSERKDSFIIQVREPRGLFEWELKDIPEQNKYFISNEIKASQLSEAPIDRINPIECKKLENAETIKNEMYENCAFDNNYSKHTKFEEFSHISIRDKQESDFNGELIPLRHKFVDFMCQLCLEEELLKVVNERTENIISKFDSIPYNALIKVTLLHFATEQQHENNNSPLYLHFKSQLGQLHVFEEFNNEEIRCINLGISTICYHETVFDQTDICVIFNESVFRINSKNGKVPKKKLIFIVQPFKQNLYRLSIHTNTDNFSWKSNEIRIVRCENIGRLIASLSFAYVSLYNVDVLFQPNQERERYLSSIQKEKLSPLSVTEMLSPTLPKLVE